MLKDINLKWWLVVLIIVTILLIAVFLEILSEPPGNIAPDTSIHPQAETTLNSSTLRPEPKKESPTNSDLEQNPSNDDKIAAILGNQNLTPSDTVRRLIEELSQLDKSTQEEAAQHIANLSDDQTATIWVQKIILNQLPPSVAEILFYNLITRSEELVLPTLASIADQPNHPLSKESTQILEPLLGSSKPGSTWRELLKERPTQ
jgi:hypothetical protein